MAVDVTMQDVADRLPPRRGSHGVAHGDTAPRALDLDKVVKQTSLCLARMASKRDRSRLHRAMAILATIGAGLTAAATVWWFCRFGP